jgi:hypothetical protein
MHYRGSREALDGGTLLTLTAPSLAALDQAIRAAKTSISSVTGPLFGIWPARLEGRFTDTHIFDKDGVIARLVITVKVTRPEAVAEARLFLDQEVTL